MHGLNSRLCVSLESMQRGHEDEREDLGQQLSILKSQCYELSVENTALAAVLLGGSTSSFSTSSQKKGSINEEQKLDSSNTALAAVLLGGTTSSFSTSSQKKGSINEEQKLDSSSAKPVDRNIQSGTNRLHPSKGSKVSAATLALIELQEFVEVSASKTRSQQQLQIKFAADVHTSNEELFDCKKRLSATLLEAERLSLSLQVGSEYQAMGGMLEERDILLRKAAMEVVAVRSDCSEMAHKYEEAKASLAESRLQIAILKQDAMAMREGYVCGLEKDIVQLKHQLEEYSVQTKSLKRNLASRVEAAMQNEKEISSARSERALIQAEARVVEDDLAAKNILVAEMRIREGAAVARLKVFGETMTTLEIATSAEKQNFQLRIHQLEKQVEDQEKVLYSRIGIEENRHVSDVGKLLRDIEDYKRAGEQFQLDRIDWEKESREMAGQLRLSIASERASAGIIKGLLEDQEETARTAKELMAAAGAHKAIRDEQTIQENSIYTEEIRIREAAVTAQHMAELLSLIEREQSLALERALKVYLLLLAYELDICLSCSTVC